MALAAVDERWPAARFGAAGAIAIALGDGADAVDDLAGVGRVEGDLEAGVVVRCQRDAEPGGDEPPGPGRMLAKWRSAHGCSASRRDGTRGEEMLVARVDDGLVDLDLRSELGHGALDVRARWRLEMLAEDRSAVDRWPVSEDSQELDATRAEDPL